MLLIPPIQTIFWVIAIQAHNFRKVNGTGGTRRNKFFRKQFNVNMHKFYRKGGKSDGLVINRELQNPGTKGPPNSEETQRDTVVHCIE